MKANPSKGIHTAALLLAHFFVALTAHGVPQDGKFDSSFTAPMANSLVTTALPLPDGKILVGGVFTLCNNVDRRSVVRLNNDGTLDLTFNANAGASRSSGSLAINRIYLAADGKTFVAGQFDLFDSVPRANLVRLITNGSVDVAFDPQLVGPVYDVALLSDGKLLVCGPSSVRGVAAPLRIYLLNSDGSVDPSFATPTLGPSGNSFQVRALSGGKILASVTYLEGATYKCELIRLNADGSIDPTFVRGAGADNDIRLFQIRNGKIVAYGGFTKYNDAPAFRLVRLNADGTVDSSFNNSSRYDGVSSMAMLKTGKVLLSTMYGMVRLKIDGSGDTTFAPPVGNSTASSPLFVTTQGEKPLVCVFQQPIFQPGFPPLPPMPPLYGVFRLNADTSAVPLIAGLQEEIITETAGAFWKVAPTGAGPFTYQWRKNEIDIPGATQDEFKIDSASTTDSGSYSVVVANAQGIAVGDPLTLTVLPPTPGTVFQDLLPPPGNNNPFVESISMAPDGKLFIPHGGPSVVVNGELQSSAVKRLLPNGQIDPTFGPALWGSFGDGIIRSIGFQSDGKILIAGSLIQLYGTGAHQGVVRFNQDGTRDEIFDADGVGSSDELFAMIVRSDDRILLGGRTRDYDSIPLGNLFRATAQGAADLDFNFAATGALGSAGSYVRDFAALPDGRIYAVGTFTTYNGMDANGALLIDPDGGLITTFASELTGIQSVTACAVQQDEKLIIAGKFIQADQTVGVVRLNRDGSLDTSFNLLPFDGEINDIVVQGDGKIIIGGDFTEIGGTPEKNLARLNADGSLDQSFDVGSGPDGVVQALLLTPEERLWVGGQFGTFGGLPRMGLARVNIGRLQKINSITASITTKATVTFRWDDDTYTLQFTDSLASGVWTDLPNKSGIEIDATAPSRFFRLHHQP